MWPDLLFNSTPQVAVIHNTDPGKCQSYCDIVQSNNCTFFIFDMRQNSCEIWTISKEDYEKNCIKREGPVNPNRNDKSCSKLANPCVVSVNFPIFWLCHLCQLATLISLQDFKEGSCMFEGSLLEHLSLITDEDSCQAACQHVPACQYYIYDTNTKDCQLLDSSNRQCDLIRGSRNGPDYRKCMMHR